jgi:hypothetical protein
VNIKVKTPRRLRNTQNPEERRKLAETDRKED